MLTGVLCRIFKHDIPNSIEYILETTQAPKLSYIGFSQGTAQAFAALSINPRLNQKVSVFVGLAPAMRPHGMHSHQQTTQWLADGEAV